MGTIIANSSESGRNVMENFRVRLVQTQSLLFLEVIEFWRNIKFSVFLITNNNNTYKKIKWKYNTHTPVYAYIITEELGSHRLETALISQWWCSRDCRSGWEKFVRCLHLIVDLTHTWTMNSSCCALLSWTRMNELAGESTVGPSAILHCGFQQSTTRLLTNGGNSWCPRSW